VVGWYPLAPWDRYQPWYTSNATHIHNVNVIVVNRPPGRDHRDRDYRDRDHNRIRGATVVPREGFVSQRPVHNTLAPVSGAALAALPVVSGASVLPTRAEIARPKPLQLSTPPATPRPAPPVGGDLVGTPANRSATRPPVGGPVAVEPRPRPAPQRLPPAVEPVTKPTAPAQSAPAPYAPTVRAKPVPQSIAPEPRANPAPAPAASPARPVEKPVARPTREEGRDKPDKPDKPDVDPTPVQKPGRGTQQR